MDKLEYLFILGWVTLHIIEVSTITYYIMAVLIFGYFIIFAVEHLMDYFRKMLPENAYFKDTFFI